MICLNRKNLLSMFNNRYDSGTYFPSSIRGKINCMLGQQNFNEARLEKALDCSTTMIVGAHITYASINERYGTSIAGVVATTPKSIVQFAGTARLQNTNILEIKSLGVMMLDLFKNWKDGAPTELIFFRDSAGLSEIDGIFDIECLKIEGAYNTTFPGRDAKSDLNLIYILVKMVKENSLESSVSNQVPYYLPKSNRSKKYKYFIIRNDSNRDDLAHVVSRATRYTPPLFTNTTRPAASTRAPSSTLTASSRRANPSRLFTRASCVVVCRTTSALAPTLVR